MPVSIRNPRGLNRYIFLQICDKRMKDIVEYL